MADREDKGNILLSGFKLDPAEKAIVDNLIRNYQNKISERAEFKEIKIIMKKQQKGSRFLHEVRGTMTGKKTFYAEVEDYNLFSALSDMFEKLIHESEHSKRTSRQ